SPIRARASPSWRRSSRRPPERRSGEAGEASRMADPTWALIAQGKQFQRKAALGAGLFRIGSGPDNDLVLPPGAGVAERHAVVEGKPGKYFLRDLETREG